MPKINPADAETERCLEIQKKKAPEGRTADIIMLSALALIILVFGLLIYILPNSDFSENENRSLASFPDFSLKSLADGSYTEQIGKFYSDQFPGRGFFVQAKAFGELAQLKMQNNSVIPGKNGTLIKRNEYTDYSDAISNMKSIGKFSEVLENKGIPVTVAIAPRAIDIMKDSLNPLYGSDRSDGIWNVLEEYGKDAAKYRDLLLPYASAGDYVWYRTDHHWTTDGAYLIYRELGKQLGYTPYPKEFFKRQTVTEEFYGTTYSSSGLYATKPDSIVYYRYGGDENYVVENVLSGDIMQGFYKFSELEGKDKYSSFIGGNNAHIRVYDSRADAAEKPTLMIVKDSFSHCLVPFLALHYNLEIIDLRSFTGSAAELAAERNCCGVLILYGADSIATSDSLTLLEYGLGKFAN